MSACNLTQTILGTQCIGDSLAVINSNFSNLDTALCSLSTTNLSADSAPVTYSQLATTTTSGSAEAVTPRLAKAWVNFNGIGTVTIRDAFNVSSVTDNATGNFTVMFSTPMAAATYCTVLGAQRANGTLVDYDYRPCLGDTATSGVNVGMINCTGVGGSVDAFTFCVAVF